MTRHGSPGARRAGAERLRIEVVAWRGAIPESRHRLQAAVSDADGGLTAATEEPRRVTTFRSAAKPFQLLPLVERGHAARWEWSDEQLAVMTASHTGSPYHTRLVAGILERLGLEEGALACGYHEPLDPESRERLRACPEARSPLYNNCSGKHAGMLCLAISEGWPAAGYERPDHPVQRLMLETVAELCGLLPDAVSVAVDGCGVSAFGLPLAAMARGYARLGSAPADGDPRARALHRIRRAMQAHPRAVGGIGRLSSALMEASGSRLVAKGGAEGLECAADPGAGLGVALKCEDGQARALGPAMIGLLGHLGALTREEIEAAGDWRRPAVHNHSGRCVGALEAEVRVLAAAAP